MFTGIVAAVGEIQSVEPIDQGQQDAGVRLQVDAGELDLHDVKIGDSIALQGACMTVTTLTDRGFTVDVSRESLNRTVGLEQPGPVNLEKALCVGDPLGGHIVSGHVDGLGEVVAFEQVGESHRLEIAVTGDLGAYMAYKGSVAINGVSLTVNQVQDKGQRTHIEINLIPHTVQATTLKNLQSGSPVNVEVDTIARYVQRMLQFEKSRPASV
ncbi:riboflavin synthase [Orrella sp. 11846]|uniref:riboflavin synthase n=1 Tax=Orrella sp. 11846 TaxID=3409913 RepID=UPI003B5BE875